MSLRDDPRGQSIQVGAILLFGVLIILLATYQAFVVPNQNRQVEANHLEEITADMQELRSALVATPSRAADASVTLLLGTSYPSRIIAINPSPPTGTIRSVGTATPDVNVTVANAVATDEEVDDHWDGTNRSFNSGVLAYRANYNEFRNAPRIRYDNTLLYHRFPDANLTRSGQRVIDGREITLVTVNGSLDATQSSAVSVDLRAVSASDRHITVTNETNRDVDVRFASTLNASQWTDELQDSGEFVGQGGHVVAVTGRSIPGTSFTEIRLELERGVAYSLTMAKVGVGTGVSDEPVTYLTEVGPHARSVQEGTTTTVQIEVRDGLNNPVSGATVNASLEAGSQNGTLRPASASTGSDGRATFEYEATNVDGASPTFRLNFSVYRRPGSDFDPAAPENASVNVSVGNTDGSGAGGGGADGAYATVWLDPSGQTGVTCPNGADGTCTLDASQTSSATLTMDTSPTADGAAVEYAVNDTTVGTVDPDTGVTDANGENETELTPLSDGGLTVYTSSGGSGDSLVFRIVNTVRDLVYNNDAVAVDGPDGDAVQGGVEFTMTNRFAQSLEITEVEVGDPPGPANNLDDEVTPNDEPQRTELYVEADSNDGWVDLSGGTSLPFTFDMDSSGFNNNGNPTATSGSTLTFYLYEFERNNGDRVDMAGESFDVTVTYQLANGTQDSKTVTVSPS